LYTPPKAKIFLRQKQTADLLIGNVLSLRSVSIDIESIDDFIDAAAK